ncbi:MAG: hypothetical protein LBG19_02265 [Prevotellaceae bacterium]|jgi:hypothetical protein|nr:hypothetical protein [Prevotellaceae bacterium]
MKKLLVLAALLVGFGMMANAQPPFEFDPDMPLKYWLLENTDGQYLDGEEIKTGRAYVVIAPFPETVLRSTVNIYRAGTFQRKYTGGSFGLQQIIGERFYYEIEVIVYTREGNSYEANYTAYNSGLQLP